MKSEQESGSGSGSESESEPANVDSSESESESESELASLCREVALARPLVHATWGAWAACSLAGALASPPTAFSHFEYAERHFAALDRWAKDGAL